MQASQKRRWFNLDSVPGFGCQNLGVDLVDASLWTRRGSFSVPV